MPVWIFLFGIAVVFQLYEDFDAFMYNTKTVNVTIQGIHQSLHVCNSEPMLHIPCRLV
jgi:hypothetical protein